jgi:N utilization substance protein B
MTGILEEAPQAKISHRKKARNLLVQALYQWQLAGGLRPDIEAQFRTDNSGKIDWDFFHQALGFVLENFQTIDQVFSVKLDRKLEQLDPIELAILRLGTYEFQQRIDVPYKVVINEYIELAKKYGATDSHKYINGVLDKLAVDLRSVEKQQR